MYICFVYRRGRQIITFNMKLAFQVGLIRNRHRHLLVNKSSYRYGRDAKLLTWG